MTGCSAPNCTNNSRKGFRLFRFPNDRSRRTQWIINCTREVKWTPSYNARLCEIHFKSDQFEQQREDGWKKLKPNAEPTIFESSCRGTVMKNYDEISLQKRPYRDYCVSAPEPSAMKRMFADIELTRNETLDLNPRKRNRLFAQEDEQSMCSDVIKIAEHATVLEANLKAKDEEIQRLETKLKQMQEQNQNLQTNLNTVQAKYWCLHNNLKCFTPNQIEMMRLEPRNRNYWSDDSILDAMNIKYMIGQRGYGYLVKKGYPLPCDRTFYRRLQNMEFDAGVVHPLLLHLQNRLKEMEKQDADVVISMDDIQISEEGDTDGTSKKTIGFSTLPRNEELANRLLIITLRGLTLDWKQVIAWHLCSKSITGRDIKEFLFEVIREARKIGFKVKGLVSDMGPRYQALWRELGIKVNKSEIHWYFETSDEKIYVFVDVPYLLKNLKASLSTQDFFLPPDVVKDNSLPSKIVSHTHVLQLHENEAQKEDKLTQHLTNAHIHGPHFSKKKASLAIEYFSLDTATALETAVRLGVLEVNALTTAWFIRVVSQWFVLVSSVQQKTAVTALNKDSKLNELTKMLLLFKELGIGKENAVFKPVQSGLVLTTTSIIYLIEDCIVANNYAFVLTGRINRNVFENIVSLLRMKGVSVPSAMKCVRSLKRLAIYQLLNAVNENQEIDCEHTLQTDFVPDNDGLLEFNTDSQISIL